MKTTESKAKLIIGNIDDIYNELKYQIGRFGILNNIINEENIDKNNNEEIVEFLFTRLDENFNHLILEKKMKLENEDLILIIDSKLEET
jgi:hypothetical protein